MQNKIFKPLFDKLFWWIFVPTAILLVVMTVVSAFEPITLLITIPTDLFTAYFFVSPFFGYVELRENSVFVRFGFFLKREIPYSKIRRVEKDRKFYSESMLALKNALDHVNIRYNTYDVMTLSVKDNDLLIEELNARRAL